MALIEAWDRLSMWEKDDAWVRQFWVVAGFIFEFGGEVKATPAGSMWSRYGRFNRKMKALCVLIPPGSLRIPARLFLAPMPEP